MRKLKKRQEGWRGITLNVPISQHDELTAQAAALGITRHRLTILALKAGVPMVIAGYQNAGNQN